MATHSMTRRAVAHDYTKTGIYHITLHVADGLWQPLGDVVGDAMAPDGMPDAPRVDMTPIGQMVEYELLHSIHEHYPMVIVDTYIIMPVSACISPREREIINESVNHGFPVITIHDNGFPDRYHPSAARKTIGGKTLR